MLLKSPMALNIFNVCATRFVIRNNISLNKSICRSWSTFTFTSQNAGLVVNKAVTPVGLNYSENGCFYQQYSTSKRLRPLNTMEAQQLSARQILHKALNRDAWKLPVDPSRILVIYFPWLGAKEAHVNKYRELYTTIGLDILTVRSKHTDFLWPANSFKLAADLIKTLEKQLEGYDHFILHSMSIGSYNLTILNMLLRDEVSKQHLLDKYKGIIFDSIVVGGGKGGIIKNPPQTSAKGDDQEPAAIDRMIKGVAKSVSKREIVQGFVTVVAKCYFALTKRKTVRFYERALDVVRDEPVMVPTLVLASKDDPMSDAVILEQLVEIWKTNSNLPVTLRLWDSSPHAQHYHYHKEEYLAALEAFLQQAVAENGSSSVVQKSRL